MRQIETWSEKLDMRDLAATHGTPLYVFNRAQLRRNFIAYAELLKSTSNVFYPVKTNPSMAVLETLAAEGCGVDCASEHEVLLSRLVGIPVSQISYYSPAPDLSLAERLLKAGGSVVLDAPSQIKKLEESLLDEPFIGKLFLRVNPGTLVNYAEEADYHRYTAHGSSSSQFGIPSEEAISCLQQTRLPFSGLHLHVGTQMDNLEVFELALEFLHDLVDLIEEQTSHRIEILNLGGGLGIPGHEDEYYPSLADFGKTLGELMRDRFVYRLEPGNSLVGDTIGLLTQVVTRKSSRGKGWAIIDAGTNQLLKVTMAGFRQTVVDANHSPLPRRGPDAIAGPLCFAGDIILNQTDLTGVKEGDPLFLKHCGSYCSAIGSRFNGYKTPGLLMLDEDEVVGLVQSEEDLHWEPELQSFRPDLVPLGEPSYKSFTIPPEKVEKMQSQYLKELENQDNYRFVSFEKVGSGTYDLKVDVRSPVSFVSAPFAVRIASDAAIVATIEELGKEKKDISVWGTRFALTLEGLLRANRVQKCRIRLSPIVQSLEGKHRKIWANWYLGDGRFFGTIALAV